MKHGTIAIVLLLVYLSQFISAQSDFTAQYTLTSPNYNQGRGRFNGSFYYSWNLGGIRLTKGSIEETSLYAANIPSYNSMCLPVLPNNNTICNQPFYVNSTYLGNNKISYKVNDGSASCINTVYLAIPPCVSAKNVKVTFSGPTFKLCAYFILPNLEYFIEGIWNWNVLAIGCTSFKGINFTVSMTPQSGSTLVAEQGTFGICNFFTKNPGCLGCPQTAFTCAKLHQPRWTLKNGTCGCEIGKPNKYQPALFNNASVYTRNSPLDSGNCLSYVPIEPNYAVTNIWFHQSNNSVCRVIFDDQRDFTFSNYKTTTLSINDFPQPNNTITYTGGYFEKDKYRKEKEKWKFIPPKQIVDYDCSCAKPLDIVIIMDLTVPYQIIDFERNFVNIFVQTFELGSLKAQISLIYSGEQITSCPLELKDGISYYNLYSEIFSAKCCPQPHSKHKEKEYHPKPSDYCCKGPQRLGLALKAATDKFLTSPLSSYRSRVIVSLADGSDFVNATDIQNGINYANNKSIHVLFVVVGVNTTIPYSFTGNYSVIYKTDYVYLRKTALEVTASVCSLNKKACGADCCGECACSSCITPDSCVPNSQCEQVSPNGCCMPTGGVNCTVSNLCKTPVCLNGTCGEVDKVCPENNACYTYSCNLATGDCDSTFLGDNTPCNRSVCEFNGTGYNLVYVPSCNFNNTNLCQDYTCLSNGTCVGTPRPFPPPRPCYTTICDPSVGFVEIPFVEVTPCNDLFCEGGEPVLRPRICNNVTNRCDLSRCDPNTNSCVTDSVSCEPNPPGDLCRVLLTDVFSETGGCNPLTGECAYSVPRFCPADGCYNQTCNPANGSCVRDNSFRNDLCDIDPCEVPPGGCPVSTCSTFTCILPPTTPPNCDVESQLNCFVVNTDNCRVPDVGPDTNLFGCQEGVGCVYRYINCSESQPWGPPPPCFEYYQDSNLPNCCNMRAIQCSGSDPCSTYVCNTSTNQCESRPFDCPQSRCSTSVCRVDINNQPVCVENPVSCNISDNRCELFVGCNNASGCQYQLKTCSDNDPCTVDTCVPETGECLNIDNVCDNNNECVIGVCDPLSSTCSYTNRNCNDSDPCTIDTCDPIIGCVYQPISCDDQNECTIDTCSNGQCLYTNVTCNDNNPCTIDSCSRFFGCQYRTIVCNATNTHYYVGKKGSIKPQDPDFACNAYICYNINNTAVCAKYQTTCVPQILSITATVAVSLSAAAIVGIAIGIAVFVIMGTGGTYVAWNHWWGEAGDVAVTGQNPIFQPARPGQGDNPIRQSFKDEDSVEITESESERQVFY